MSKIPSWLLFLIVIALAVVPLMVIQDSEFGGADGQAGELAEELAPEYEPWFESIWSPPGGETESLLFALQSALGAGVIGYVLGYLRGKKKTRPNEDRSNIPLPKA